MEEILTKVISTEYKNYKFIRSRNNNGECFIEVLRHNQQILYFGNTKAGGTYGDSYEIMAQEFAKHLDLIANNPCSYETKKENKDE